MNFEDALTLAVFPDAGSRVATRHNALRWVIVLLLAGGVTAACSPGPNPQAETPATAKEQRASEPVTSPLPEGEKGSEPAPQTPSPSHGAESFPPKEELEDVAPHAEDDEQDAVPKRAARRSGRASNKQPSPSRPSESKPLKEKSTRQLLGEQLGALAIVEARFGRSVELKDCGAAESFVDSICSLAERICRIEQELPSSQRCPESRNRCRRARQRLAENCQ